MILCRIFIGFSDTPGFDDGGSIFNKQGENQTLYVIDELAIRGYKKHDNSLIAGGTSRPHIQSEFRESQNYSAINFIDKCVRPIIIQEHFGVRTTFSFPKVQPIPDNASDDERRELEEANNKAHSALFTFAKYWMVAVDVPDGARSIPDGATGVLVPKPYSQSTAPGPTRIKKGIDGLSINTETA